MTEQEAKALREKLFVIAHQFGQLKDWEVMLINSVDEELTRGNDPSKVELEIINRLHRGEIG